MLRGINGQASLEYGELVRIDDIEATKIIIEEAQVENTEQIQNFEKEKRNNVIKELKTKGLSIRKIERLIRTSFGVIRNI